MRFFIIAGEASGDLHASNLVKGLINIRKDIVFDFIGGDLMSDATGQQPVFHFSVMNFMGIFDVLMHVFRIRRILNYTKSLLLKNPPTALILVDYAGFNLRIAKFAKRSGIKVFYYISPKVWAWNESRVQKLKKYIDKLFVIFPFEVPYFKQHEMNVDYYGNPLSDAIREFSFSRMENHEFKTKYQLDERPIVALLAGSRKQEIKYCLPVMLKIASEFPEKQFIIAGAPSVSQELYKSFMQNKNVKLIYNDTYQLLDHAEAAIVTSGTATLETALFRVPQVVIYKTGLVTYALGKLLVSFNFFSLVNLILEKELVKEALQYNLEHIVLKELKEIFYNDEHRTQILEGYDEIIEKIGKPGSSARIAERMLELCA